MNCPACDRDMTQVPLVWERPFPEPQLWRCGCGRSWYAWGGGESVPGAELASKWFMWDQAEYEGPNREGLEWDVIRILTAQDILRRPSLSCTTEGLESPSLALALIRSRGRRWNRKW